MSAFKKKTGVSQPASTIQQKKNKLNLLLGLGCSQVFTSPKKGCVTKELILACAMFWDSKKRIDKIKSLMLKQQNIQQFNDTQDFQVSQLMSIQLLSLSRNNIMHLQPISVLDTLICLNINYNKVYELAPLSSLIKLQELYASNNQIKHIDPLKNLSKLRIINFYCNKINRLDETCNILQGLKSLQQLDIQQNPVYSPENRKKFLALQKLIRFNGELIFQQQLQSLGVKSQSVVVIPTAKFRDTHTSFFTLNKSQVKTSITGLTEKQSQHKIKLKQKSQLSELVQQLQKKYFEIDDKFQQQIVKNVQLKSQFLKKSQEKKILARQILEIKDKEEEITQLKRKVKMLKQNLFNNQQTPRKGELLRQLFQLEMLGQPVKNKQINTENITNDKSKNSIWIRKFDFDQQIFITNQADNKYLINEDEQLALLLSQNNSALQQIKRELREMKND